MSIVPAIARAIKSHGLVGMSALFDRALIRLDRVLGAVAPFKRLLRFATCLLLAVFVAGLPLDFGVWTPKETFKGPFRIAESTAGLYAVDIGAGVPFWLGMRLVNAGSSRGEQNPRLTVNGRAVDMPATPRAEFARGLSIWSGLAPRELLFALPAGVANDQRIELSATYTVRLHASFHDIALWGLAVVLLLQFGQIWRAAKIAQAWLVANMPSSIARALAGVVFVLAALSVILLTRVEKLDVVRDSLRCYQLDGRSCAGDVVLTTEFSGSTLSTNPVIRLSGLGPAILTLKMAGPVAAPGIRGSFMLYRMEGVVRPQLLIVGSKEADERLLRPWELWKPNAPPPGARTIHGTTPDYIRWNLAPSETVTDGSTLVLRIERTFGVAEIAFGPVLSWRTRVADTIWKNGWIGALLVWPFWLLLLIPPLFSRKMRKLWLGRKSEQPPDRRATDLGFRIGRIAFTILLTTVFILPLWYWLPLRAIQLYLPEPISFHGNLGALIKTVLEWKWPSGIIVPQITPLDVAPLGGWLNAFAFVLNAQAASVVAVAVVAMVAWFGAMPWRALRLPPVGPAPMAAGIVAFVVLMFLESWRMPIGAPAVIFVGLGTTVTILIFVIVLSLMSARLRTAHAGTTYRAIGGRDWAIVVLLTVAYFAFRFGDVNIPGTIYTDETASYSGAYVLLGGAYRWARTLGPVPRAFAVAGGLALLGVGMTFLIWISRKAQSWIAFCVIALGSIAFVVATADIPITMADGLGMFRYPPFVQFIRAWFAVFNFDYLTAGRLATLAAAATSFGLIYLLARAMGATVISALIGCAIFAAAHIVHYFAIINGDAYFHVATTIATAICVVTWLTTARPIMLLWAGVATLGSYFFRQSAVELIPAVIITAASAALFDQRFRSRETWWALLAYLVTVFVPIILYQKVLVGSWYGWANPPLTWLSVWVNLHDQSERWFAEPWTFSHANGTALIVALIISAAVALWDSRTRLIAIFFVSFFVIDVLVQHLFARMIQFQGYDRFLIPLYVSVVALILLAIGNVNRRVHRSLGSACGIALFLFVFVENRYTYEPVQCVRPLEYAPLAQYNGEPFFFAPEKELRAALAPEVKAGEAAFVSPGSMALRLGFGLYSWNIGSQEALHEAAKRSGHRFLAFLVPQTEDCRARTYYLLEGSGADYMSTPMKSLDPERFGFIGRWDAAPLQIQLFEVR